MRQPSTSRELSPVRQYASHPVWRAAKTVPWGIWHPSMMQFYSGPPIHFLSGIDTVDPNQKTMMVEGFVAAFAKAARVSDVPEEAITSDTREPSYMFLAAEWNRSTVSERAYLLAMLFGREFEVEANDFSLQIAASAMMMLEPDGSPALIARADLAAADDGGTRTGAAD